MAPFRRSDELRDRCSAQTAGHNANCQARLTLAQTYDLSNDPRAELEFRNALSEGGRTCPSALFEFSEYLTRKLEFQEAANVLQSYIKITPVEDHEEDRKQVSTLLDAARLKRRVDNSEKPGLNDLVQLTRLVDGFGRRKIIDARGYAEKALELYPDSVDAIVLFVELLMPAKQDLDKIEQLLNKALALEPDNAQVLSTRGWFYLFSRNRRFDAEKDFRLALSLSGNRESSAWKGLGYVLMFNGQKREAIGAFENYLSSIKDHESDTEVLYLIERLKNSAP